MASMETHLHQKVVPIGNFQPDMTDDVHINSPSYHRTSPTILNQHVCHCHNSNYLQPFRILSILEACAWTITILDGIPVNARHIHRSWPIQTFYFVQHQKHPWISKDTSRRHGSQFSSSSSSCYFHPEARWVPRAKVWATSWQLDLWRFFWVNILDVLFHSQAKLPFRGFKISHVI